MRCGNLFQAHHPTSKFDLYRTGSNFCRIFFSHFTSRFRSFFQKLTDLAICSVPLMVSNTIPKYVHISVFYHLRVTCDRRRETVSLGFLPLGVLMTLRPPYRGLHCACSLGSSLRPQPASVRACLSFPSHLVIRARGARLRAARAPLGRVRGSFFVQSLLIFNITDLTHVTHSLSSF